MPLKYYILHLCLLINLISDSLLSASDELVRTQNGLVRGYKMRHANYKSYLGIPYAVAPVGENRFKAPKTASNWSGIYEANHTVECPQRESVNEDCLVINVFTPLNINKDYIPVIFYIHGGAYILGKGPTEGFDPLIRNNVIVVTFNYRLGALGFLCLGSDLAPGNAGLMDQLAALRWVHRNIKGFGGDPKQVTIYGTSAGASSAELLLLYQNAEKEEEYFHQVILESGSALNVWAVDKKPLVTATKVYLNAISSKNYKTVNMTDLENFYSVVKPSILNKATMKYYNLLKDGTFGFAPCVNKKSDGEKNQFMTIFPRQKLRDHNFKHVPVMVLYSTLEGLYITNDDFHKINSLQSIKDNFKEFLPADLQFDSSKTKNKIANLVQKFYMKSSEESNESLGLLHFLGDSMVLFGVIDSVFEHGKKNRVHLMEFSYKGELGLTNEDHFKDINVAGHAELKYYAIINKTIQSKKDKLMVDKVSTLLTNFVKYGNPTPSRTELLPFIWPPAPSDKLTYLMLGHDTALLNKPYAERMALWRAVYRKFGC